MNKLRGFEPVVEKHLKCNTDVNNIIWPLRGTSTSAGYDFFAPCDFFIKPKEGVLLWTDVKAYMQSDEVLELYPRSSVGIKRNISLKNTVGIIDSDYYSNESNDGNIGMFLWNYGTETQFFERGEAIIQGIFKKFLESDNCNSDTTRLGGIGSTNKK